ncbi:hypothetical protein [Kribbia dieselivorans]|uniref:hypothetical protein n=1 Tax=Kribbia dieselivorans TaxID=331526 RepID=UPI000838CD07|nr:hypothetical protein [Kribbia dieselivorans]
MALFCDATLLVLGPCETDGSGDLTTSGHARALAVAEHVRERRIARVAGGTTGASSVTASALADALDVPVWLLPDLDRGTDGWADAVQTIADQHRGETVLVVAAIHHSGDTIVTELLVGDDG